MTSVAEPVLLRVLEPVFAPVLLRVPNPVSAPVSLRVVNPVSDLVLTLLPVLDARLDRLPVLDPVDVLEPPFVFVFVWKYVLLWM
jgi:hypothetical protein